MEFTEEDLDNCWPHHKEYFLEVLNGKYTVERAREDLQGLIGSKHDLRVREGKTKLRKTGIRISLSNWKMEGR